MVTAQDPQVPADQPPPDVPEEMAATPPFTIPSPNFMAPGTEIRAPNGVSGGGLAWFRLRREVVPAVAPSPSPERQRRRLRQRPQLAAPWPPTITFVDAGIQLSLRRDPVGAWVRMASVQHWQHDATRLAESELWDP